MKTQQSIRYLSIFALIFLLAACSSARYTRVPRSHATKPQDSRQLAQARIQPQNNTETLNNAPTDNSEREENQSEIADESRIQDHKTYQQSIILPPDTLPDDSIEIDIVHETKIAEDYGKKGYMIGLASLISLLLLPLLSIMSVVGLIFSVIAYQKMIAYDLPVKNRRKIEYGLIINAAILLSFIAIIILLFLLFW